MIALSFLIPAVMNLIVMSSQAMPSNTMGRRGGGGQTLMILYQIGNAMRPLCVGLGVLFAFLGVIPRSQSGNSMLTPAYDPKAAQRPQPFPVNQAPPQNPTS